MKIIDGNNYHPLAAAYDAAEDDVKVTMGSEPAFVYARAGRAPRIIGGVGTDALHRYYRALHVAHMLGAPDRVITVGYVGGGPREYFPRISKVIDMQRVATVSADYWRGTFYIIGKPGEKKVKWFGCSCIHPAPRIIRNQLERNLQRI